MNLETIISRLSDEYASDPKLDLKNLIGIVKSYDSNDYLAFIKYSDDSYNRVVLFRSEAFEILLLCWNPKQASGFHKHASNGCIMKVLSGTLTEERKHPNNEYEIFQHDCDTTIYMSNELGAHRVYNETDSNVVSLHVYSPSGFHS